MLSTYIVLFPDIIATLLVLDQLIVFWLAATEQICQGPNNQSLTLNEKPECIARINSLHGWLA